MFKRLWEYWVKGNWNVVVYGKTGKVKCRAVGLSGFRAEVEEAANCCGYGYYDVIICSACGTDYSTEHEAEHCCQEEE